MNPEWVEAGARADVPAASYVCNPADGHHWVSQLSQERIWVQTCSLCREMRLDLAEHDAAIRADERERLVLAYAGSASVAAIKAEVRAKIAADLLREAARSRNSPTGHHPDLNRWTDSATLKLAARIARGES